jgi:hypothetical protein
VDSPDHVPEPSSEAWGEKTASVPLLPRARSPKERPLHFSEGHEVAQSVPRTSRKMRMGVQGGPLGDTVSCPLRSPASTSWC